MRSIQLLVILLLLASTLDAQTTYSKLYWTYPYVGGAKSIAIDDDNLYIVGKGASYIDGISTTNVYFMKLDHHGSTISYNHLIGDGIYQFKDGFASSSALVNDTVLYVAGYFSRYDTLFPPWNTEINGMLYAFNLDGDTLFAKKYIGDGQTDFRRLISSGNSFVLGGNTHDTIYTTVPSYLIKTDLFGAILWEQHLGDGIQFELTGLMDIGNKGQIVTGGSIVKSIDMFGIYRNGKVYKTDASGIEYFSKEIGTTGADTEIEVKVSKNYQSYIVRQNLDTVINEGDYEYVQYIGKTDTNFNFLWRTFLNDEYYKYIYTLRTFEDGSIVAVGGAVVDDTYDIHGYIVKLDSNGTVLWERDYATAPGGANYLYDFQKMPDGGYICSGLGGDSIDGGIESMAWLLRLDSMGCLIPGCDEVSVPDIAVNSETYLSIYPNPFGDAATVEVHLPQDFAINGTQALRLDIYDMQGRLIDGYSNIYPSNPGETIRFKMYRNTMTAGNYFATLKYGNAILNTIQFVLK